MDKMSYKRFAMAVYFKKTSTYNRGYKCTQPNVESLLLYKEKRKAFKGAD